MYRTVIAAALVASSATAFLAPSAIMVRPGTQLSMAFDNDKLTSAENKALDATKKFGARSPEAAAAWDTYEEIAASDNTAASKPGLDESCSVEELQECKEYQANMAELETLMSGGKPVTVDALAAQNRKLAEENARLRRSLSAYK